MLTPVRARLDATHGLSAAVSRAVAAAARHTQSSTLNVSSCMHHAHTQECGASNVIHVLGHVVSMLALHRGAHKATTTRQPGALLVRLALRRLKDFDSAFHAPGPGVALHAHI